jgi:tRNA wybutosine-synthesizing protein 3
MKNKEYLDAKEKALKTLEKAYCAKKVDDGISQVLEQINSLNGFYTSSSCAGRIVLLQIPTIGDKCGASFLGIWHRKIAPNEFLASVSQATIGLLWLLAQSPIIHIGAETLNHANSMVKTAISSGFKNSSVKSTGKKIIIELASTERLDAPIGRDGLLFCDEQYLQLLIEISNEIIERSQNKLVRLTKNLAIFADFP